MRKWILAYSHPRWELLLCWIHMVFKAADDEYYYYLLSTYHCQSMYGYRHILLNWNAHNIDLCNRSLQPSQVSIVAENVLWQVVQLVVTQVPVRKNWYICVKYIRFSILMTDTCIKKKINRFYFFPKSMFRLIIALLFQPFSVRCYFYRQIYFFTAIFDFYSYIQAVI